jgi:mRNA interferase MazF
VAAITSQISKAKLPTHIEISSKQFSLEKDSVILLEQLRTIDKRRLKEKITHLNEEVMGRVDEGIRVSLGLIQI